jgi:hypothetical protein
VSAHSSKQNYKIQNGIFEIINFCVDLDPWQVPEAKNDKISDSFIFGQVPRNRKRSKTIEV